jgi:hypothetical protein
MKFIALLPAAALMAAPAIAGPYLNVESNSAFSNKDYTGTLLETHAGYENDLGESASWYIQGGPAFGFEDGEGDTGSAMSGKIGLGVDLTRRLNAYGEVAAITGDEWDFDALAVGVKAGLKYSF